MKKKHDAWYTWADHGRELEKHQKRLDGHYMALIIVSVIAIVAFAVAGFNDNRIDSIEPHAAQLPAVLEYLNMTGAECTDRGDNLNWTDICFENYRRYDWSITKLQDCIQGARLLWFEYGIDR